MISIYEAVLLITITGLLDNKMLLFNVAEFIQANFTSYIVVVPGGMNILSMGNYFLNKHLYCEAFKLQTLNIIYVWHFITDKAQES